MSNFEKSLNKQLSKFIGNVIAQIPLGKERYALVNHLLGTDLDLMYTYMKYVEPCNACCEVPSFSFIQLDESMIKGEALVFGCRCHKVVVLGNENIVQAMLAWNREMHPVVRSIEVGIRNEKSSDCVNDFVHSCNR